MSPCSGKAVLAAGRRLGVLVASACVGVAAGRPVRVNLVSPAGVKIPSWWSLPCFREPVRPHDSEEAANAARSAAGGGSFVDPEVVARLVAFVAGPDAAHIIGTELPVGDRCALQSSRARRRPWSMPNRSAIVP